MKCGTILDRNPWVLFVNFKYFDAIRAFKERHGADTFNIRDKLLEIIDKNARLPTLPQYSPDYTFLSLKNETINEFNQLPYLIEELNSLNDVEFLYDLLEYAISKFHDNFVSFFLHPYITSCINNYYPINHVSKKSGQNLLKIALEKQNNVMIQAVYYHCPSLIAFSNFECYFNLWKEKHSSTLALIFSRDIETHTIMNSSNKNLLQYAVEEKQHIILKALITTLTMEQLIKINMLKYLVQVQSLSMLELLMEQQDFWTSIWLFRDGPSVYHANTLCYGIFQSDYQYLIKLLKHFQGIKLIDQMIECKLNRFDENTIQLTPLMIACLRNDTASIDILLRYGADKEMKCTQNDKTAFEMWQDGQSKVNEYDNILSTEMNNLFMGGGALVNPHYISNAAMWIDSTGDENISTNATTYFNQIIESNFIETLQAIVNNETLQTYLLRSDFITMAMKIEAYEILECLVEYKNKISTSNYSGISPYLSTSKLKDCQLFYSIGFPVENNGKKQSPLYYHCNLQNEDIVKWLLHNAATFQSEISFPNALMEAAAFGYFELFPILVKCVDPMQNMSPSGSPLHFACQSGSIGTIQLVMNLKSMKEIKINQRDDIGMTPIHYICSGFLEESETERENRIAAMYWLIQEHKADVNVINDALLTPLHYVAQAGCEEAIKILIKANADIHARNTSNETPLSIALAYNHPVCVAILISSGAHFNQPVAKFEPKEVVANLLTKWNYLKSWEKKVTNTIDEWEKSVIKKVSTTNMLLFDDTARRNLQQLVSAFEVATGIKSLEIPTDVHKEFGVDTDYKVQFNLNTEQMQKQLKQVQKVLEQVTKNVDKFVQKLKCQLIDEWAKEAPKILNQFKATTKLLTVEKNLKQLLQTLDDAFKTPTTQEEISLDFAFTKSEKYKKIQEQQELQKQQRLDDIQCVIQEWKNITGTDLVFTSKPSTSFLHSPKSIYYTTLSAIIQSNMNAAYSQGMTEEGKIWENAFNGVYEQMDEKVMEQSILTHINLAKHKVASYKFYDEQENESELKYDNSHQTDEIIERKEKRSVDKNIQILDVCLLMLDNGDMSQFATTYWNDIVMKNAFHADWNLLYYICSASQYYPILAKLCGDMSTTSMREIIQKANGEGKLSKKRAFGEMFTSRTNVYDSVGTKDTGDYNEDASSLIETLVFAYSDLYVNTKSHSDSKCIEYIMRECVYAQLRLNE